MLALSASEVKIANKLQSKEVEHYKSRQASTYL